MTLRVLLDTHVFLWWAQDDARLGPTARQAITTSSLACISMVSAWEIAIKRALGKLDMLLLTADLLEQEGFALLPMTLEHVALSADVPLHHRDPFDRMLIAQARCEGLTLITHDRRVFAYEVALVRA